MKKKLVKWPSKDEMDGETKQLIYLVERGWDWNWPGWDWVTRNLNGEFGNNRTVNAVRQKYRKLMEQR